MATFPSNAPDMTIFLASARRARHLVLGDWFPTFVAAAGNPHITEEMLKGKQIGDRTYKNHLDGYNQMAAITGKGPSARHEIFYLGERTGWPNNGTKDGAQQYFDWFKFQFWRFVFVQQVMGKEIQTFLEYPPMQRGASFNLDAIKAEMGKRMAEAEAASKGTGQ